jgi:GT2 family glycosyltransferase
VACPGAAAIGRAYLKRSVYLAFATGPQAASADFLDRVAESNSDATLLVIARQRPQRGEWIEVRKGQGTGAIIAACRKAIGARNLAGAAVHATRQGGEWRMRLAALVVAGLGLRVYNENLDHFPVSSTRILWRHMKWRWSQRPRGAMWWSAAAQLALACGTRHPAGRIDETERRRFSSAAFSPGISVVIPSRDGRELLGGMLPGVISDLREFSSEVIVVDNGSSDGTADFLLEHYPQICLESSAPALSFSEAVNRGIQAARYSHVVLLNNDMQIEPGFFAALRSAFDRTPELFCATAQIFFPPGQRREETGLCFWRREPGDEFPVYCAEPSDGEDGTEVLYGSGGCSMYDTAKLRELGGFDEMYRPAYVEDLDIGYRGWQKGWPTVFCAGAKVEHRHRATTSRYFEPGYLDYLVERNYLRFLVRSTGDIFPELWRDAIARLKNRAIVGDKAARRALQIAWREALSRGSHPVTGDERARKQLLTK